VAERRAGAVERLRRAADASRVLVVGSLNVDLILRAGHEPGDEGTVVLDSVTRAVGGHAGNCAAALAALGLRVSLLAGIGDDADGDALHADLTARGVDTTAVRRFPGAATGTVYIPVFGTKHYMMMARGANDRLTAADVAPALAGGVDAVMLFDPARPALLEILSTVRGPLLCWSPGGIYARDPGAAELAAVCDVVLVNRDEQRHLTRSSAARSPAELVVTLGEAGSTVRTPDGEWTAPASRVDAVDPTGAGDAFAASYLLARLAGLAPAERLAAGNAAGALAVTAVGARARLATVADLAAALDSSALDRDGKRDR